MPLALCYVAYYLCVTSDRQCGAVGVAMATEPGSFLQSLAEEMSGQTPQGAMTGGALVWQLIIACLCVHTVIDYPRPSKAGELWGSTD